jgi:hypothetical protein
MAIYEPALYLIMLTFVVAASTLPIVLMGWFVGWLLEKILLYFQSVLSGLLG